MYLQCSFTVTSTYLPYLNPFFQGAPQFVETSVGDKYCMAVFEFETKEACNPPDSLPEIPCSLYDHDNKLRDLTPLIKSEGKVDE